jgi:hypothetical protein
MNSEKTKLSEDSVDFVSENNMTQKHENYELLNMIGYGLAKFDKDFIKQFGFKTKDSFYKFLVEKGVADTKGAIKNRQDMHEKIMGNGDIVTKEGDWIGNIFQFIQ